MAQTLEFFKNSEVYRRCATPPARPAQAASCYSFLIRFPPQLFLNNPFCLQKQPLLSQEQPLFKGNQFQQNAFQGPFATLFSTLYSLLPTLYSPFPSNSSHRK